MVEIILCFHYHRNMEIKNVVHILTALAQTSRLNIYRELVAIGPEGLTPSALCELLELAPATLSFHLKELSRADLISVRQDGRFLYYSANYSAVKDLVGFLTENCCQGKACAVTKSAKRLAAKPLAARKKLTRK